MSQFEEYAVEPTTGALLGSRVWILKSNNTRTLARNWLAPNGTNPTAPSGWRTLRNYTDVTTLSAYDHQAAVRAPGFLGANCWNKEPVVWDAIVLRLRGPADALTPLDITFGDETPNPALADVFGYTWYLSCAIDTLALIQSIEAGLPPVIQYLLASDPVPARWLQPNAPVVRPKPTPAPKPKAVYLINGKYYYADGSPATAADVKIAQASKTL